MGLYLAAKSEELEEQRNSPLIELALCAWQCLTATAGRRLPTATPEQIDAAEAANLEVLQNLDDASELQSETLVQRLVGNYHQPELLGFVLEVLMGDDAENPELAPESVGMELLWLKTLIDCLDRPA